MTVVSEWLFSPPFQGLASTGDALRLERSRRKVRTYCGEESLADRLNVWLSTIEAGIVSAHVMGLSNVTER